MIGTEGTRLLREKARLRGDPAGESRGGSPTARGKRVPYVPIYVPILQTPQKKCFQFVDKRVLSK
ncbi:hypothetical protein RCO48_27670 [Peribacillus frigoritolerans]|nr:hypothetical protein [Peribacillus frigoritolerans]